ncbi:MAG: hypothetical protein GY933_06640 [Hyphomicrobiales bacterium]|nr:hypothetical protein [Hyphomicrobiales bacterium]
MGVIIDLSTRLAEQKPDMYRRIAKCDSAKILVFTGVRYEEKKQEKKQLIADQSRSGKL